MSKKFKLKNKRVFVCSDHHFGQANFMTHNDKFGITMRPEFKDVDDMNDTIVSRHNEVVPRNGSVVFFLGDLAYNSANLCHFDKMNGETKILVGGNHDAKFPLNRLVQIFDKIVGAYVMRPENIVLTHIPVHPQELQDFINIHGHLHRNTIDDDRYLNVCLELNNYYPTELTK